jgi:hypothetical protein
MTAIVFVRPEEDSASKAVGTWLAEFEEEYKALFPDRPGKVLQGPAEATRSELEGILSALPKRGAVDAIIVFYGHGTRCSLCVKRDDSPGEECVYARPATPESECDKCRECAILPVAESLIDCGNRHLCTGREVYAVACHSARKLGKVLIHSAISGTAYFGYNGTIVVPPPYYPDLRNRLKDIVNHGLEILVSTDGYGSSVARYEAVAYYVRNAFRCLSREIRLQKGPFTGEQTLIRMWWLSFDPDWVQT